MCKLTLNSSAINITFELSFIKKKDKKLENIYTRALSRFTCFIQTSVKTSVWMEVIKI